MRICLLFCGFIRNYVSSADLSSYFREQFPDAKIIDIYMFAPNTLDSENPTKVDTLAFEETLKKANLGSVNIVWHTYDPIKFYEKSRYLGFSSKDAHVHRYPPSRKLSMIYNYSKTAEIAYMSGIKYDLAVLTRFDYVMKIQYKLPKVLENDIYLFRNYKLNAVLPCAEDRLIYGDPNLVFLIKDMYNEINTIFKRPDMCCEELFSVFYWNRVEHKLLLQNNSELPIMIVSEYNLAKARAEESMFHESQTPTL